MNKNKAYFAAIKDAWRRIPAGYRGRLWASSPEHLRKYALIEMGYRTTERFECESAGEAARLATILRADDEFAVIEIDDGPAVLRHRAQSQAPRAMVAERREESQKAVLAFCDLLVGKRAA